MSKRWQINSNSVVDMATKEDIVCKNKNEAENLCELLNEYNNAINLLIQNGKWNKEIKNKIKEFDEELANIDGLSTEDRALINKLL